MLKKEGADLKLGLPNKKESPAWILYMGTYPPRECGIATFTRDLKAAIDRKFSHKIRSKVLAMNNNPASFYNYPREVIMQISDGHQNEYIEAAGRINRTDSIRLINIQHEFGIFGGEYGRYLLCFLDEIKKPVIVTFHTVLPDPNEKLKRVVQEIAEKSACIIVMNNKAIDILANDYGINKNVFVVPHGIPTVPFVQSAREKAKTGLKGRIVISSFGLISSNKGYEHVIEALPEIIKLFPSLVYLIIGQTHPVVRNREGEKYRIFLEKKVESLNLQKHVKFCNRYLALNEIIKYLKATDVYISSAVNPNQIVSGTLSYALGCGRPVISTPFLHAKEAISHERGFLCEFKNPASFAEAITKLLSEPNLIEEMGKNAYYYTRHMTWPNVALAYMEIFSKYVNIIEKPASALPKVKFSHLAELTDDFGVIQFAKNVEPETASGYTLDDNARAMIASCMHYNSSRAEEEFKRIRVYFDFIKYVQNGDGRLYNLVDYGRKINFENWSDDAHGRALWALGLLISTSSIPAEIKEEAKNVFEKALRSIKEYKSPRAAAFTIIGIYYCNKAFPSIENIAKIRKLAEFLVYIYNINSSGKWKWFEKYITYSNSKLAEALFYASLAANEQRYLKIAQESLEFLMATTFENGMLVPVGNNGWFHKNSSKANFDQQPEDVSSMVQTLSLAHEVTRNGFYKKKASTAFQWFLGNNTLKQVIYDESTGGCYDGIGQSSINLNQGAESTISYLIARLVLD